MPCANIKAERVCRYSAAHRHTILNTQVTSQGCFLPWHIPVGDKRVNALGKILAAAVVHDAHDTAQAPLMSSLPQV